MFTEYSKIYEDFSNQETQSKLILDVFFSHYKKIEIYTRKINSNFWPENPQT